MLCQVRKKMNTAEITPYSQALQIKAIPKKGMKGVSRGARRPKPSSTIVTNWISCAANTNLYVKRKPAS
jgi:hypothetical protein